MASDIKDWKELVNATYMVANGMSISLALGSTMRGSVATLHSPDYLRVRTELIAMRTRAGFTQRELAAKLRQPHQWVGRSELGERRLDVLETMAWCHACGENAIEFISLLQKELGVPYILQ